MSEHWIVIYKEPNSTYYEYIGSTPTRKLGEKLIEADYKSHEMPIGNYRTLLYYDCFKERLKTESDLAVDFL